jgi:hypothetical protein
MAGTPVCLYWMVSRRWVMSVVIYLAIALVGFVFLAISLLGLESER